MSLDFRNLNLLWASIIVETLSHLGLTTAILCPGSRSTPLTIAFAQHPQIDSISILDERSAAFFALGIAKRSHLPVVLVCTSGTAGANFYPAVIEAKYSQIPLLILTADRPPELRECHPGQTIDQVKLYGHYPCWQLELALPQEDRTILSYLRQTIVQGWRRSLFPCPGVVHFNVPFREPLAPLLNGKIQALESTFDAQGFFKHLSTNTCLTEPYNPIPEEFYTCQRGVIIGGLAQPQDPQRYVQAIASLSQHFGWVVLAEGLSPLRNYQALNPYLISTYDLILRNSSLAVDLSPEIVIQVGELPTSKILRHWLRQTQSPRWILNSRAENVDPLHGSTIHLSTSVEQLVQSLQPALKDCFNSQKYLKQWCKIEQKIRSKLATTLQSLDFFFEGKIAWFLSQHLPPETPIFIANSMPVRDVEFFWMPNNLHLQPFFNRGANGIDGTLSTALGMVHCYGQGVLLTGDLSLLHDTNGLLQRSQLVGHLTIVLINNNGGGIFEMLPISQFNPPFEEFFATPQAVDFSQLCRTYNLDYTLITSWEQLKTSLNPLPETGIQVLEIKTNRKIDSQWRRENLNRFAVEMN